MYSVEEINHIIYNNRSFDGVVKNFMPKLEINDLELLLEIGNQLKFVNRLINKDSSIIIDKSKLDLDLPDIKIFPEQLENIKISSRIFSEVELNLLNKKGIPDHIIEQYDISSLSNIKDLEILKIIGVTSHPILKRWLGDGISEGIIIPLYNDGKLINCVSRKTNNTEIGNIPAKFGGNKYTTAIPDLYFWGDEILENEEIWLCEGSFDMMALREQGKRCISSCSCALNDFQYFNIIKKRPKLVNIFSDNDVSGYRSAMKSKKVFGLNGINSKIYSSKIAKDSAEHFFELKSNWDFIEEVKITPEMLNKKEKNLNFLKYLSERNF